MDDFIRRVIAEDEIAKRDFNCWQAQRRRQQQEQQEREQSEAQHHREQRNVRAWLAQSAGDEVRTTDFLDGRDTAGNSGTQQPQPQQFMNDQQQAHWDAWCKAIARAEAVKAAVEMNDLIVADLDRIHDDLNARFDRRKKYFEKQDAELRAELETLKTTVAELASEIRDLWAAVEGNGEGSNTRSNVVPLLTLKGGRDAA